MKNLIKSMFIPLFFSLSSCVFITADHEPWETRQDDNRRAISQLQPGMERKDVLDILGEPSFSESFQDKGHNIQVYYYRTHRSHEDGKTTRDETTPVVFIDNSLTGWGHQALSQAKGLSE